MTHRFATAALALCSVATRALGWRPHDFWTATPAELAASLGLLSHEAPVLGLDRQTLDKLMENDHG